MRTAEMKSNEEWSSQLWKRFVQLRKKAEKIPVRLSNKLSYEATDSPIVF